MHYNRDFGIECRIARFHNIYGPHGTWKGGREKAPAAFCRKVLTSTSEIEMWGDGKQTRSFTYIDDCVEGILRITKSDFREPLNLGSCEMVSMNEMMAMAMDFEGKVRRGEGTAAGGCGRLARLRLRRRGGCVLDGRRARAGRQQQHACARALADSCCRRCCVVMQELPIKHIPGPEGVRGRNSDNELILEKLGWQPTVSLRDGLRLTYFWIKGQLDSEVAARGAEALAAYAHSTVVKTGAPTELGSLRNADGEEGFESKAGAAAAASAAAAQVAA